MPIYEFECQSCHQLSEHIMKISDDSPQICPYCNGHEVLKKVMSRSSFVLKGKGWYETDFKDAPKKESQSLKGSTQKEDATKVSKKSNDKPLDQPNTSEESKKTSQVNAKTDGQKVGAQEVSSS